MTFARTNFSKIKKADLFVCILRNDLFKGTTMLVKCFTLRGVLSDEFLTGLKGIVTLLNKYTLYKKLEENSKA